MAKAARKYMPSRDADERWTVAVTVEYLTRIAGLRDDAALYELTEALFAGDVPMTVRRFLGGKLVEEATAKPSFLRGYLMLKFLRGKAYATSAKALMPGRYECLLPARTIQMRWPAKRSKKRADQDADRGRGWKSRYIKTALLDSYPRTSKPPMNEQPGTIERRVAAAWEDRWPDIPVPSARQIMRVVDSLPD
jgi:hypothetical protein